MTGTDGGSEFEQKGAPEINGSDTAEKLQSKFLELANGAPQKSSLLGTLGIKQESIPQPRPRFYSQGFVVDLNGHANSKFVEEAKLDMLNTGDGNGPQPNGVISPNKEIMREIFVKTQELIALIDKFAAVNENTEYSANPYSK